MAARRRTARKATSKRRKSTTGRRRTKTVAVRAHMTTTASGKRVRVKAHRRAI